LSDVEFPRAYRDLFREGWRDLVYRGGRGGGKSHAVGGALVITGARSQTRIVCAREIQESLRDSVKQLVEDKISDYGLESYYTVKKDEIEGLNGTRFVFKGMWRNPDALKSLEGADIFWGEEAAKFSSRSIRLIRPTLRKPKSRMIWTYNPEFDHDPVDKLFCGEHGPPPPSNDYPLGSIVKDVSWRDNPWFEASPLKAEMENDYRINPAMADHVWGGDYMTVQEGAYYAKQLIKARDDGRICQVVRDPLMQIRAFWDIGTRDHTAIWIAQWVGNEIRIIDHYEAAGQPLSAHLEWLRRGDYDGCLCVLPHDGDHVNHITANAFESHIRDAGFQTQVVKNQGKGAALKRVEALRRLFHLIWFNEDTTRQGVKAIAAYHEKRDEQRNFGLGPEHDWSSHSSDALGLMAIAYEEPRKNKGSVLNMPNYGTTV
jgi:phage terminase large subunit